MPDMWQAHLRDLATVLFFAGLATPAAAAPGSATDLGPPLEVGSDDSPPEPVDGSFLRLPGNRPEAVRARIRDIARAEIGHHDRDTGDRAGRYYGHGSEWCSEFVSWVYHAAGVPLGGGHRGPLQYSDIDWILEDTGELIDYFAARGAFVRVRDLAPHVQPRVGDYAYIERGSWEHSGIITELRREADGSETLVTVDGNHRDGSAVQQHVFRDWRRQPSRQGDWIVGIGFLRLEDRR
jgi:hypothetical protein